MNYDALETAANAQFLTIVGAFHPEAEGAKTILLLGPDEPAFWPHFTTTHEYQDGQADPMNRWSKRVIGGLADQSNGRAQFPSDGPPYPPFIAWALACDSMWESPVGFLVHHKAGLFVSFRGAIALPDHIELPPASQNPCVTCDRPCLTACPVDAISSGYYDVPSCKSHLNSAPKIACMETGCFVRRSCPISEKYARVAHQSAFHMASFNPQ